MGVFVIFLTPQRCWEGSTVTPTLPYRTTIVLQTQCRYLRGLLLRTYGFTKFRAKATIPLCNNKNYYSLVVESPYKMNKLPRERRKQNKQEPPVMSTTPLAASGGRKLLSLPRLDDENEDFVVDEEDYLVVSEILSTMGVRGWEVEESVRMMIDRETGGRRIHDFELRYMWNSSSTRHKLSNLPPSIGNLVSLKTLDLCNSGIVSLPPSVGKLRCLECLYLAGTVNLSSLPKEIGQLRNLKVLNLSWTDKLTTLPKEIGELTNLKRLTLENSNIVWLPPSIGRLHNLEELDLSWTKNLRYLPNEIGNMVNLRQLRLVGSRITLLPPSIGRLRNLKELRLLCAKNFLTLPNEIGDLVGLESVNLYETEIRSLPLSIGRWKTLQNLDLGNVANLLEIPEVIGELTGLKKLSLFSSKLTLIPSSFLKLRNLRSLDLRCTRNLSKLPEDIGDRMTSLTHLGIARSGITSLPESLGRLKGPLYLYGIGTKCIPEMQEGNDSAEEFLVDLVRRWPSLGYLDIEYQGWRFRFDVLETINIPLACNRARVRTGFSTAENNAPRIAPKLWPLALSYALCAFSPQIWDNPISGRIPLIRKFDAVYHLIAICRASFIEALLGRNQHAEVTY